MQRASAEGMRERVVAWSFVALWASLILGLSTDTFSADETSRIIGPLLDYFFPGLDAPTRALVHVLVRKLAHFFEYAVLGLLSWRALRAGAPRSELRSAALAIAFVVSVAAFDETGQAMRAHRTGSRRDVVLDTSGGIAGICLALGARALARRRTRSRALLVSALLLVAGIAHAAEPESLSFVSADGFVLKADLWKAADAKAPVAILLHQFNLDRHSFSALVPALRQQGFAVLALDQRGQGDSTTQKTPGGERAVRIQELPRTQVGALVKAGPGDVAAALALLTKQGLATDRIALVGASYGCTVSLLATGSEPSVRALALLSPGTDYFGVDALAAAKGFRGALFAIAAEDDPVKTSPGSARALALAHEGPEELLVYPGGGHGVALLAAHPELPAALATFLAKAVAAP